MTGALKWMRRALDSSVGPALAILTAGGAALALLTITMEH